MNRSLSAGDATAITYRYERWRAVCAGIIETAAATFLLIIAVRWYAIGPTAKALIAGGGSFGFLISPLIVAAVQSRGARAAQAAALLFFIGSASLLLPAIVPHPAIFIVGSMVGLACAYAAIPLLTQLYQENYPAQRRGRLFSRTIMIRIAAAAVFSHLGGLALSKHIGGFQIMLLIFAICFAISGYCVSQCPSSPLLSDGGTHPFRSLRFAREDPLFRRTLVCWMLMGFANLMMLPLRVEYLANPRYGKALDVSLIALATGVVPNIARLVLSPIWGWLFDNMNFFLLRVVLNIGFALGILTFFTSSSVAGLVVGGIVYGISTAGGDVAWGLWVTKFAPTARVADYMSVHTFFTGIRGVAAPLAAFHLINHFSLATLGWGSAVLIALATILLLPELKYGRRAPHTPALIEEIAE